jgi:2',3'-cyclic-nucleotide 2'-phosphodiesterase (5'-nucleotidase family)
VYLALCVLTLALMPASASAGIQHVYIVHTNDIHGSLMPAEAFWMNRNFPPPLANAPGAVNVIRELREQAKQKGYGFLLLDGGDVLTGTPLGDFTKGQAVADYFRRAGYDAVMVGNHDFDDGWQVLKALVDSTRIPWLGTNIHVAGTDTQPSWLRSGIVLERGGIKIGLFGLITKYLRGMVTDSQIGNLDVLPYHELVRQEIAELRRQGADIIVALNHIGYNHDRYLSDSIPGIDAIIGAHSHSGIRPPYESPRNHTVIQQAYSKLSTIGILDLRIDTGTRKVVGYEGRLFDLSGEAVPMDMDYLSRLDSIRAVAEKGFDEVLGRSRRELTRGGAGETPAGNMITDAMRDYAGADIAVHNSSGIRANIPEGDVTYRDVYQVDVFGNTAVVGTFTGKQVRDILEVSVNGHHAMFQVSGVKFSYAPKKPIGEKVLSVEVAGKPLDDAGTYKLVTNSFLAQGSGEYVIFTRGQDIEDTYMPLREIIAGYIRKHSPVDARLEGRITAVGR